ncbi:MAG TPA: tetratricopeptide repeat protein [Usitatibacter sp.]|nr:tetratricopeptide repeat protein [Usitatibacter sp.]
MADTLAEAAMSRAARLYGAGDLAGAKGECEEILRADPVHFYALHLLATIAAREDRPEDCVRIATRALRVNPSHAEALSNRGAALRAMCHYEEALADYDRALALAPRSATTLNNRGVTLAALGRHREAVECYDAALGLDASYARARFNRALSRLMLGDYRNGWEDYESRWAGGETPTAPRPFAVPSFGEGDWGAGHRVALWTEQGLGDELLFSTLVVELAARGEAFVLEADRRMLAPFARAHPGWEVVAKEDSDRAFARCDRHLPLGSLGRLLRDSRESFARQPRALLAADAQRTARYRARLAPAGERVIGISWRSFQPKARRYYEITKSAPLAAFAALAAAPDTRLLDLQYGDTAAERETFAREGNRLERIEGLDLRDDIDGVLAAIEACDAVVTTSNVTAHLAGSVGKRTLLIHLGGGPPFHYWVPDREGRSRWYPTVEIVAGAFDTWSGALCRVQDLLERDA